MAITRKFILKTGEVVNELPVETMRDFEQKIINLLTPLAYEAVINEAEREKVAAN